jgi:hypothetical protein
MKVEIGVRRREGRTEEMVLEMVEFYVFSGSFFTS